MHPVQRHALLCPAVYTLGEGISTGTKSQKKHSSIPLRDKREISIHTHIAAITQPRIVAAFLVEAYLLNPASTRTPLPAAAAALLPTALHRERGLHPPPSLVLGLPCLRLQGDLLEADDLAAGLVTVKPPSLPLGLQLVLHVLESVHPLEFSVHRRTWRQRPARARC